MVFLPYAFAILFVFLVCAYGPAAWRWLKGVKLQNLLVRPRVRLSDKRVECRGPHWFEEIVGRPVVWTVEPRGSGWLARADGKPYAVSENTIAWFYSEPPHSKVAYDLETKLYEVHESERAVERVGVINEEHAE